MKELCNKLLFVRLLRSAKSSSVTTHELSSYAYTSSSPCLCLGTDFAGLGNAVLIKMNSN